MRADKGQVSGAELACCQQPSRAAGRSTLAGRRRSKAALSWCANEPKRSRYGETLGGALSCSAPTCADEVKLGEWPAKGMDCKGRAGGRWVQLQGGRALLQAHHAAAAKVLRLAAAARQAQLGGQRHRDKAGSCMRLRRCKLLAAAAALQRGGAAAGGGGGDEGIGAQGPLPRQRGEPLETLQRGGRSIGKLLG